MRGGTCVLPPTHENHSGSPKFHTKSILVYTLARTANAVSFVGDSSPQIEIDKANRLIAEGKGDEIGPKVASLDAKSIENLIKFFSGGAHIGNNEITKPVMGQSQSRIYLTKLRAFYYNSIMKAFTANCEWNINDSSRFPNAVYFVSKEFKNFMLNLVNDEISDDQKQRFRDSVEKFFELFIQKDFSRSSVTSTVELEDPNNQELIKFQEWTIWFTKRWCEITKYKNYRRSDFVNKTTA